MSDLIGEKVKKNDVFINLLTYLWQYAAAWLKHLLNEPWMAVPSNGDGDAW